MMTPLPHLARRRNAHRPVNEALWPLGAGDEAVRVIDASRATAGGRRQPKCAERVLVEQPITDPRRRLWQIDRDALNAVIMRGDIDDDPFIDARRANDLRREHRLVERGFVFKRAGALAHALRREEQVITAAR